MTRMAIEVEWIAVDWGTTNLRLWLMSTQNEILDSRSSNQGMSTLQRQEFEPALLALIDDCLTPDRVMPVICCGMAGAAQGWIEAPYAQAPCAPPGVAQAISPTAGDGRLQVAILPGVKQIEPADVMRGEETQIAGFLFGNPGFAGTLCLPGTHTKWVRIENGRIEKFQTVMTGELFGLLANHSVLRHSVQSPAHDSEAFADGCRLTIERPEVGLSEFFRIRARALLQAEKSEASRGRLSGLLIGMELATARPFWQDTQIQLIGDQQLTQLYKNALELAGVPASTQDAQGLTLLGLTSAFRERQA